MPFNNSLRLFAFTGFCVITNACGLLPDFGSDKMSNSEKAELNLQMGVRYLEVRSAQENGLLREAHGA